ncbi:hypothetical protein [Metabacillus niabensis]|uniref:hypothetical protein n=1 Tax=Metabacillus niabensis TaxID=324854 RepID=UPI00399EF074
MFKRKAKAKQPKDTESHKFVIGNFSSGKTNTPICKIQSKKGNKIATLFNSIAYMRELGAIQAIENPETGLNLALLNLGENESLSIDDSDLEEVIITRIK